MSVRLGFERLSAGIEPAAGLFRNRVAFTAQTGETSTLLPHGTMS
jgi:hypothetical protein